jgi:hypothetical protein
MPGHLHLRMARWLRLGLTSLALVLGAIPAHALPAARTVVTLSVEQRESAQQRPVREASAHSHPRGGMDVCFLPAEVLRKKKE